MRLVLTLMLVSGLVVLSGCISTADGPGGRPTLYGSASEPDPAPDGYVVERPRRVAVREVARPAPSYERSLASFTPPPAPDLPADCVAEAEPVIVDVVECPKRVRKACKPKCDPCCPGGNCGIPSIDCCPGGNCGIPSVDCCPGGVCGIPLPFDPCRNPCKK